MPNYFNLTLDTTGPASPTITLAGGAAYTSTQLISANVATTDGTTTGYQMKFWGDLDVNWSITNGLLASGSASSTEANALWVTYATSQQLNLSTSDGLKNVYLKLRDDVYNPSAQASSSITLNATLPTVTISGPDVSKISTQSGKNASNFSFTADQAFTAYEVRVVSTTGATESSGVVVGSGNGSVHMSGNGTFASGSSINCTIYGADLAAASAGDGVKIIKVFVKDNAGQWSV